MEFALVAPLLLLLFAAAGDFGRVFYAYVAIENAAKEGALYGSRAPECSDDSLPACGGTNNIEWRVRAELAGQGIRNADDSELTPTVVCLSSGAPVDLDDCESGDMLEVGLIYEFRLLTPILGSLIGDLDLTTAARAVVLNAAAGPNPQIPGISIDKFVSVAGAENGAEVQSKCQEPQDVHGSGYFRSPCQDSSTAAPGDVLMLQFEEGDTISYRLAVVNTGPVALTGVTVADSRSSLSSCGFASTIGPNSSLPECTYTQVAPVVPGADLSMEYENVATADSDQTESVSAGAVVTVLKPPARLSVEKYISPYELGSDGDGHQSFGQGQSLTATYRTAPQVANGTVWFKIRVVNTGGQPATGFAVTDSRGTIVPSGTCPAVPSSLAAGDAWICRYPVDFSSASQAVNNNTVSATAANVTPDGDDSATATLRVQACNGNPNDRTVPKLVGLTKAQAATAWSSAGFTSTLTTWANNNGDPIVAQSRAAYSCARRNDGMTVHRTATP